MIELNERDVKAVANSRFWHKYRWKMSGVLIGGLVLGIVLAVVTKSMFGLLPLVAVLAAAVWLVVQASRYEKELVKEWKKSVRRDQIEEAVAMHHND